MLRREQRAGFPLATKVRALDPERQLRLAQAIGDYRRSLQAVVAEIQERGTPLSDIEADMLIGLADARLELIESELLVDGHRRLRRRGTLALRRRISRLLGLLRPRIGNLRHYDPRPLRVPTSYLREFPPPGVPTIALVTPSFQQANFVERTIYSVANQNYPALEYVVWDGGSTDGSLDVIKRNESALTAWFCEPDDGQADAINRAFAHTSGEVMAYLNSDDLLLPGALAFVGRFFAEHPDVDVVYGDRVLIDENDGDIGWWVLPDHDDEVLRFADYVPQETLFWRRRIWEAAGGVVDPSFRYALDWDLLLRFQAANARIVHLPRFLGAFRVHEAQKTTADDVTGQAESDRLRSRVHHRRVRLEEVLVRQRPYMGRHVRAHLRRRFAERLCREWHYVETLPRPALGAAVVAPAHSLSDADTALGRAPEQPDDAQSLRSAP